MGMGTIGWKGKGKTNGIEFQSDGAWPEWPTRTAERQYLPSGTVFLGAPPGFSAWPATYGSLTYIYLSIYLSELIVLFLLFCLPSSSDRR